MKKKHVQLIQYLIKTGILTQSHIIDAFDIVDRGDFVLPHTVKEDIYADRPLSIWYGQTISQPSTVAFMLELLQLREGQKVLDVGSGSGWTSALLGQIVGAQGRVYGVEIIPELVIFGRRNVAQYHDDAHVSIMQATHGAYGDPTHAPFDRILVSAAAHDNIPLDDLIVQLKIDGIMVIPVRNDIVVVQKLSDTKYTKKIYHGFAFVPLVH